MGIDRLNFSAISQFGPHLGIKGLAQFGGSALKAATVTAMFGAAVGGAAQEVPQQGQHFLLHHLRLSWVGRGHKLWKNSEKKQEEVTQAGRPDGEQSHTTQLYDRRTCDLFDKIYLCFAL